MERRVALVTGGNRGLGFALVEELAIAGFHVLLTARAVADGSEKAEQLRAGDLDVRFFALDVTAVSDVQALGFLLEEQYSEGVEVVFNNAAVCLEGWDRNILNETMAVNLWGVDHMMSVLSRHMRRGGAVVNVSSGDGESVWFSTDLQQRMATLESTAELFALVRTIIQNSGDGLPASSIVHGEQPAYKLSKYALNRYTQLIVPRFTTLGVDVNCICPGDVKTGMNPNAIDLPREAAKRMLWLTQRSPKRPTGQFLRDQSPIPW